MRELVKSTLEEHRQVVAKMTALEGEIASAGELRGTALTRSTLRLSLLDALSTTAERCRQ